MSVTQTTEPTTPPTRDRRRAFIPLLALGTFALGVDAYVMAGLLPLVADGLDVSASSAGQMVTVFTLCYALGGPVFATLLAARPAKTVLGVALVVFTLGNALTALAPTLGVLLIARAVAGVGAGVYSPIAAATAAGLTSPERRGRALATVMGGLSVGTVVGVPAGMLLASHMGWRGTLWLITALGAVALIGVVRLPDVEVSAPPPLGQRVRALAGGRVAGIVTVSLLGGVSSLGLYTYLAEFLEDAAHTDGTVWAMWAWGAGGIVGSLLIGPVVDRTRRPFAAVTCVLALIAAAQFALPAAAHTAVALTVVPLVVWGAAGWAVQVPQQHQLIAAQPRHATVAVSLNSSAVYLGSGIGSALGGLVLGFGTSPGALPYCTGALTLLALALHLTVVRGATRRSEEPTSTPS
ncbi:MFS transporter [Streptomyces mobaraensis]|uniref:Major facilitator superfamily protein n=1 Tax=Streptomyces mobaraensis (strain ATCC 29032 / DSM 40847 / JCM 4168 / NBRC 13819 / NCIMB 11159 / IPCR 16-22) TaxID=1223523 RepID=M3BQX7_STRM1|nr:MFS transporter [Streptomyces mobaraensis]EMF02115.1 major facilitator superfamily protein [Streptomyces mobaraensis NBRC 13819 = DSM 40847]